MSHLQSLIEQRNAVDREIAGLREQAAAQARELLAQYGLAPEDIFGRPRGRQPSPTHPMTGVKKIPQFRDPSTGATWSGRGMRPRWLKAQLEAGGNLADFRISP